MPSAIYRCLFPQRLSPRGKKVLSPALLEGNGFRRIERLTGVSHNTVINWVKKVGNHLTPEPDYSEIPEIAEIDELQTYVGKKNKIWLWTVFNTAIAGIIAWVVGDRSADTFKALWLLIKGWQCFFYVTDGYVVYPQFIEEDDHIVNKTYMTRVEGENTRLRHYLARLHRKTLCYSKSVEMLSLSVRLVVYYLKPKTVPLPPSITP